MHRTATTAALDVVRHELPRQTNPQARIANCTSNAVWTASKALSCSASWQRLSKLRGTRPASAGRWQTGTRMGLGQLQHGASGAPHRILAAVCQRPSYGLGQARLPPLTLARNGASITLTKFRL